MVDHHPLDGRDHDVAGALLGRLAGRALDGPCEAHRVVLGLIADLLQERGLGLLGGHLADAFEGHDLLLARPTQLLALRFQLLLLDQQLPVALLEHVRALVELLVALQQPVLEVAEVGALRATLVLQLPLHPDLLLLGLEDEVLLLGACLRDDAASLVLGGLDGLVRDDPPREESHGDTADDRHEDDHDGDDIVHRSLPSGPGIRRYVSKLGVRTYAEGRRGTPTHRPRQVLADRPPRSACRATRRLDAGWSWIRIDRKPIPDGSGGRTCPGLASAGGPMPASDGRVAVAGPRPDASIR